MPPTSLSAVVRQVRSLARPGESAVASDAELLGPSPRPIAYASCGPSSCWKGSPRPRRERCWRRWQRAPPRRRSAGTPQPPSNGYGGARHSSRHRECAGYYKTPA